MTILLLAAFVLLVILVEYLAYRNGPVRLPTRVEDTSSHIPLVASSVVEGFRFAENVRYHPGHTWALAEGARSVRVGIDDFASRLVGSLESISLPEAGKWVRQGQPVFGVTREGKTAKLVSPIEGIVTKVNTDLDADPNLARTDPYGSGWLMVVEAPEAETSFRNLVGGSAARALLRDASHRLKGMLQNPAPSLAQDGGSIVDDLTPHLSVKWEDATSDFFQTQR